MEAIESSSLISSAVEVATQYRKFLVKGLKAGHAEFSKLYAYCHLPVPAQVSCPALFAGRALGRLCVPLSGLYMG
jgi:hypothetical protein